MESQKKVHGSKPGKAAVEVVLVDEEVVGTADTVGCGAKVLRGSSRLENISPPYWINNDNGYRTEGDSIGKCRCHKGLNMFSKLHNDHLWQAILELRLKYPDVHIIYADYYKAFMVVLKNHTFL